MALPETLLTLALVLLPTQDGPAQVGQYRSVDDSMPPVVVAATDDGLVVQLPALVAGRPKGDPPLRSSVGPLDVRGEHALPDVPGRTLRFDTDLEGGVRFVSVIDAADVVLRRERPTEVPEGFDSVDGRLVGEWSAEGSALPVRIWVEEGRLVGQTSVDTPKRPLVRVGGRRPEWLVEGSVRLRLRHEVVDGEPRLVVRRCDGLLFVRDRLPAATAPAAGVSPFLGTYDLVGQTQEVTSQDGVLRMGARGQRARKLIPVGPSTFRLEDDPASVLSFVLEGRRAVAVNLERYGSLQRCERLDGR